VTVSKMPRHGIDCRICGKAVRAGDSGHVIAHLHCCDDLAALRTDNERLKNHVIELKDTLDEEQARIAELEAALTEIRDLEFQPRRTRYQRAQRTAAAALKEEPNDEG